MEWISKKTDSLVSAAVMLSPLVLFVMTGFVADSFAEARPWGLLWLMLFVYFDVGREGYFIVYLERRRRPPSVAVAIVYTLLFTPFFLTLYLTGRWKG